MKRFLYLLGVAVAALAMAGSAGADQSYTDPVGDAGVGTDIVGVTVRNDTTSGLISIQVASANPVVANHAVAIFIDADRNQATGDQGDDYWMFGGPLVGRGFFATPNGSTSNELSPASFWAGQVAANMSEFRFNKADIGNVSGFNFWVASISIDPPYLHFWDGAPNSGYWSYDLAVPAPPPVVTPTPTPPVQTPVQPVVKPKIGAPMTLPAAPVAGKRFTVSFPVVRSDSGAPLTTGTMICDPSVNGKVIPHAESFKNGTAKLSFTVPKTAKGKMLKVKVTIKTGSQSATKVASFLVR